MFAEDDSSGVDASSRSAPEEKPRKQQKMQAIYADIDAVLMDRD
eukprot:COSAG06_NODE_258_length_18940_cov_15.039648_19_plen_44_part_00